MLTSVVIFVDSCQQA